MAVNVKLVTGNSEKTGKPWTGLVAIVDSYKYYIFPRTLTRDLPELRKILGEPVKKEDVKGL